MNTQKIIFDIHEINSETVVSCDCGSFKRKFVDGDKIGLQSGNCIKCNRPKKITEIVSNTKIQLFPHKLLLYLLENDIPFRILSLSATGGDFIIPSENPIVIERKTMGDLLHTWLRGDQKGKPRFETQLQLCLNSYDTAKVILLIEDYYNCALDFKRRCIWIPTYDEVKNSSRGNLFRRTGYYPVKLNPKSLLGKLDALEARAIRAEKNANDNFNRLEIVKCSGADHAVEWFAKQLAGFSSSRQSRKMKINRIKRPFTDLRDKQLFFLEGLPQLGPATSNKLLEVYGNPLKAIKKIGEWKGHPNLGRITKKMLLESKKVLGLLSEEGET